MITKNFKLKVAAAISAGVMVTGFAQAAEPLVTFKEMVEQTVTSNPEVQSRYHTLLETGFEQEAARGGYYPKVDLVGRYRRQEDVSNNFARQNRTGFGNPRFNSELVIGQMLFDGFATKSEVSRLDHNKKQAFYDLQNEMQSKTLEFTTAYMDILRFRQLAEMAKENYVIHKQIYSKIAERVSAGVARKVDQDQASGRLALAEANLLVETTNLHDVTARLQRLYGALPPATLEALTFHNNGIEPTVEEALKLAYAQNPDLLAKIEGIQASKDAIKGRKAAYLPRFDLQARKNVGHSRNGRFNDATGDNIELQMNYNLFNGFSDKNRILQEAQRLNNTVDLRDKACVDTRQTVVIAYNDIRQLKEQLTYRLAHKNSIESAKVAYDKQFDIGQRTLLDLLDTQNEYFQAKRSLTNTEYDLQTAYARTYAGQGELLSKIGVVRGDLPEITRGEYPESGSVCEAIAPSPTTVDKQALYLDAAPLQPLSALPTPIAPQAALAPQAVARTVPACSVAKVTDVVKDWASAAAQKNVSNFLFFYSDDFVPETGLAKAQWEDKKRKSMRARGKTRLSIHDINASCDGNTATADFKLKSVKTTYHLKKVADTSCEVCNMKRIAKRGPTKTVQKRMDLQRVNGQWKILNETTL